MSRFVTIRGHEHGSPEDETCVHVNVEGILKVYESRATDDMIHGSLGETLPAPDAVYYPTLIVVTNDGASVTVKGEEAIASLRFALGIITT